MPSSGFDARLKVEDRSDRELIVRLGEVDIATYVYRPDAVREEAPKPYFHPLRTVSGSLTTVCRPWDHRWHKGLQMTWSHVSDQNFWGGPTYDRNEIGSGYVWRDNLGRQRHDAFTTIQAAGNEVLVTERLSWISSRGETWFEEVRSLRFFGFGTAPGTWALDFHTTLKNVHHTELVLGSPATHGRKDAGYTGLFWRGPRSWTGAMISDAGGDRDVLGRSSEWAAIGGQNDEVDGGATVLMFAGTSSAQPPIKWFTRSETFVALNPSPAFDSEVLLAPLDELTLNHRVLFIDGTPERETLVDLAREFTV